MVETQLALPRSLCRKRMNDWPSVGKA
jgi:hypothetical protein